MLALSRYLHNKATNVSLVYYNQSILTKLTPDDILILPYTLLISSYEYDRFQCY